jgi:hypothetical protein
MATTGKKVFEIAVMSCRGKRTRGEGRGWYAGFDGAKVTRGCSASRDLVRGGLGMSKRGNFLVLDDG